MVLATSRPEFNPEKILIFVVKLSHGEHDSINSAEELIFTQTVGKLSLLEQILQGVAYL
jgi:hypothetical protein